MSNHSSTSSFDLSPLPDRKPRRRATMIALALFMVANWIAADFFNGKSERNQLERYETQLINDANHDSSPLKIILLGNSQQNHFMRYNAKAYKEFETALTSISKRKAKVYNFSWPASNIVFYQLLLSKIKLGKNTLVIVPLIGETVTPSWGVIRSAFETYLARPAAFKQLGWEYYFKHIEPYVYCTGLFESCFPLCYFKEIIVARFFAKDLKKNRIINSYLLLADALKKGKKDYRNLREKAMENQSRSKLMFNQLDRMFTCLQENNIPCFTYFAPTKSSYRAFRKNELAQTKKILANHHVPFSDFSNFLNDSEFKDDMHPDTLYHFTALISQHNISTTLPAKKIKPSSIGLVGSVEEFPAPRREAYNNVVLGWSATPKTAPFFFRKNSTPLGMRLIVDGKEAFFLSDEQSFNWKPLQFCLKNGRLYWGAVRNQTTPPRRVTFQSLAFSHASPSTDPQTEKIATVYEVELKPFIRMDGIARVSCQSGIFLPCDKGIKSSGFFVISGKKIALIAPSSWPSLAGQSLQIVYDVKDNTTGPLAKKIIDINKSLDDEQRMSSSK